MTTQPAPAPAPNALPPQQDDLWYVWSNGTADGSWHPVNEGTLDECETFVAVRHNPNIYVQEPGVRYLVLADGADPAKIVAHHETHSDYRYNSAYCQLCRYDLADEEAARENEHNALIDQLTCTLADQTGSAIIHVGQAQNAIAQLVSSAVYDIEFAEGIEGSDVIAGLAAAARELRNVERIVMRRREYLLENDRHAREAAEAQRLAAELADRRWQHEDDQGDDDVRPGDEGTCGAAVYPNDPDRDVQCMLAPHGSEVEHSNGVQA